jgi:hypothetical protein
MLSEKDEDAAQVDEAQEIGGVTLVAHDEAAKVAQPSEEPLDLPASREPA